MVENANTAPNNANEQHTANGLDTPNSRMTSGILDRELPQELQQALGTFVGTDSIESLSDWATIIRHRVDGSAVSKSDLCTTDQRTANVGILNGVTYHFACFYDAVILAALEDHPVDIRTKSPSGVVIEARAIGTDNVIVSPRNAVFSFGIESDSESPPPGGPTLEHGYTAICPYIKAFPTRAAYDQWSSTVSAPTIAMPLTGATHLAAALVD